MPQFSVIRTDRTFVDARGLTIHYYVWSSARPKAIVQITHGLGEHALRYEDAAQKLVAAGFSVWADDHRGHGATGMQQHGGDTGKLGKLGAGGLRAAIQNVREFTAVIREENPGLPVFLLGQSWGSLMVQDVVNRHPGDYAGAILTGTAYRTLRHMNGGDLNAKHQHLGTTGFEWLSRDPAVAAAFVADPLAFRAEALKLFGLADSLRLLGRPAKNLQSDLPILIMIGSEDSLGGEESIARLAADYATRSQLTDVEAIVYPQGRHEVLNEINRDEVFADLIGWLDARAPAARTP